VALASHLKALGQDVRMCVPPDFREWIESLGIPDHYDQPYWARQVQRLGIGTAHTPRGTDHRLIERRPAVAARATSIGKAVRRDVMQVAARQLVESAGVRM
jgi:vancomycin aglycone glucosyltransferase